MLAHSGERRADTLGDHRADAVGADHQRGAQLDGPSVGGGGVHSDHPTVASDQVGHRGGVVYLDAGVDGGVHEHRVEEGATRCVEGVDPV